MTSSTTRGVALNDYARANDPFAKVGKSQVAVDISSVIRASNDSFRGAWIERRYENASLAVTERWTAILTIAIDTAHDPVRSRKNPLGIFVHAINGRRSSADVSRTSAWRLGKQDLP
jgi:type IV secretion system protein TrbF